jgi:hypothetical protein
LLFSFAFFELEGIQPSQKVELTGKDGGPVIKQVMILNGKEIEF